MRKSMLRLLILLILLSALSVTVQAIECIPGSGNDVTSGAGLTRDRDFYYHNNTDDQHWYGTNKWAVRFDFSEVYPSFGTSSFVINKVKAYFPVTPDTLSHVVVNLYSDAGTAPGIVISTTTIDSVSDWIEFTLDTPVTVSSCWMLVTCNTTYSGPYISASVGGGHHSYYWDTNMPTHYFQNLYLAGIYSEFLFSVTGHFELSDTDLELNTFDLKPSILPGRNVYPEFTIINNTDSAVDSAYIDLSVTSPNPDFALQDTIYVNRTIAPNGSVFLAFTDPVCQQHPIALPVYPTQFRVRAILHTEFDLADTLFNNNKTVYYNSFNGEMPFKMVENFIRTSQSELFLQAQDVVNEGVFRPLNYFPVLNDPHYRLGAVQRFNWYGFSGQPMTVAGGDDNITGFNSATYPDAYTASLNELNNQRTFLSINALSFNLPDPYTFVSVRVTLRNPDTYVFNDGVEPSLVRQSRFYAALYKKEQLFGQQRYVFDRWAAYQDTIGTAIPLGESWLKQFAFSVSNIGLDSLMTDYDLVFWIQHNTTKQIIFSGMASLNEITANNDDVIPSVPLQLTLSPNPVRAGRDLHLDLSGANGKAVSGYRIYNIKGQLVCSGVIDDPAKSNAIPISALTTSGIYLIRFDITDRANPGKTVTQSRKFIVYQ
jgi:hypothetical protein